MSSRERAPPLPFGFANELPGSADRPLVMWDQASEEVVLAVDPVTVGEDQGLRQLTPRTTAASNAPARPPHGWERRVASMSRRPAPQGLAPLLELFTVDLASREPFLEDPERLVLTAPSA
jgi:hypothetical protein